MKLNMHPSFDSKIPLLKRQNENLCSHKNWYANVYGALVTSRNWKQARCLSYGERIKLWCVYTMAYVYTTEYCWALNGGTVIHARAWMDLKCIMLCEKKSQMLKGCHLWCDSIKRHSHWPRVTGTENRWMVAWGWSRRGHEGRTWGDESVLCLVSVVNEGVHSPNLQILYT